MTTLELSHFMHTDYFANWSHHAMQLSTISITSLAMMYSTLQKKVYVS